MIRYVPGKGWVNDNSGMLSGDPVVLNSPEAKAQADAYLKAQREWRDGIGNYEQYADGTIGDLAGLVNGDRWWDARLHHMANEVGQGDQDWFLREFSGRGNRDQAKEMVNRFLGLKEQGYSDQDIMRGIYGDNWGALNPDWMDTDNPDNLAGAPAFDDRYDKEPTPGGKHQASQVPNGGITPAARKNRLGAWGSGYTDGGYGLAGSAGNPPPNNARMFSEENEGMRKAITTALENKLLG